MKAAQNMVVSMRYTLTDEDGNVIDSSADGEPLVYLHGHGNIITGLEKAIEGTEPGHRSRVTVAPKDAYGDKDPDAIFEAQREQFDTGMKLTEGLRVHAEGPDGPVTLTVVRLTEKGAILDANHPLAGKTLNFDVEVLEVRRATAEEIEHGHVHSGHAHD